jgi:hypothetical protein
MGNRSDPNLGKGISVSKSRKMRVLVMSISPEVVRLITHGQGNRGNIPVTRYSSSESMVRMSFSSISKLPISEFSMIRSFFVLLGNGT